MNNFREVNFGEYFFSKIDSNRYLQEIYQNILFNYSIKLFGINNIPNKEININDALSFADILSKSCFTDLSDMHKTRAQEIVALLHDLYPYDKNVKYYLGLVLSNTGNFLGMKKLVPRFKNTSFLDDIFMLFNQQYLSIPFEKDKSFFPSQKEIYNNLSKKYFSYSAPTSMGKSFIMRTFIKQSIIENQHRNFALLVPTKALINEVSSELIGELTTLLKEKNYRIVTSLGSIALESRHNYIFVLTPERMMYVLIRYPNLPIDYLFIDEAHKISSGDKRSAFYYKVIDKLEERDSHTHVIFASPNIPNPSVYFRTISNKKETNDDSSIVCKYAPVSQLKYIVDLQEKNIQIFDSYSKSFIKFYEFKNQLKLSDVIVRAGNQLHSIVYCKSKNEAIEFAKDYSKKLDPPKDLNVISKLKTLADTIRNDVHQDYYLAELVENGVAYHIGYLPANIKMQIEDYYREGSIRTMFCTSTLLEGVNLPAENLFITSYKKGRKSLSEIDFKNLIGRVGRIRYNLYGNVFLVRLQKDSNSDEKKKYENLLKNDVAPQKLSIETELKDQQKELIIANLKDGNLQISKSDPRQSEDNYDLMRKTMLILADDIAKGNNSCVHKDFEPFLTPEVEAMIKRAFIERNIRTYDDINVSYDQMKNIERLIKNGLKYPAINDVNHTADYYEALDFMNILADAFNWKLYEYTSLGSGEGCNYTKLSWYTVLLIQWMEGHGLNYIIDQSLKHYKDNNRKVRVDYNIFEPYNDSKQHKNIIIADTLEAIEDVVLFRISNYFLKFSEEYKKQHPNEEFTNDWYEFVEYGTTNRLRIILQRSGYKRDSTEYIRRNAERFVKGTADNPKLILDELMHCSNELVKRDTKEIQYNVPELFI